MARPESTPRLALAQTSTGKAGSLALRHEHDLIALECTGILSGLERLAKARPAMSFDVPGRQSVMLPPDESPWLEAKLKETSHIFSRVYLHIGNRYIARLGLRAPQDDGEVFRILRDAYILPPACAAVHRRTHPGESPKLAQRGTVRRTCTTQALAIDGVPSSREKGRGA